MTLRGIVALALFLVGAAFQGADDKIGKFIQRARTGSPVVRPQAADRLVAMGAPAAERILAEAGHGTRGLAGLGRDLIEVLGQFDEPRLRARLWEGLDDRDFPWRPAAARSLASTAEATEAERFEALMGDPLSAVRVAGVQAIQVLDRQSARSLVVGLLHDPDDRVRRAAASLLDEWGLRWALLWLVEDLKRTDRYFESRTGATARFEAARTLQRKLGDLEGYQPRSGPDDAGNVEALAKLDARVRELAGGDAPELPPIAQAGPPVEGSVLGLELRSCRRGELFLRWTRDDRLVVGVGNPAIVQLAPGTVASLVEAAGPLTEELGDRKLWGEPGCDLEQFHFHPDPDQRVRTWRVAKGAEAVEGLRPGNLGRLAVLLVGTLPETGEDSRLSGLRERARETLKVLGGALPERP